MVTPMVVVMMRMRILTLFRCRGDDCFSVTCHLSFVTKKGCSFRYESNHVLRGRVSIEDFLLRMVLFVYEECSEDFLYLFLFFIF